MCVHGDTAPQSEYGPLSPAEIETSGLDYLALGHVHQYSGLRRAGETFWAYPGCPEGRGFDELGEKGVLWLEVEKGRTEAEFVPLCRRRYQILVRGPDGQADPPPPCWPRCPHRRGRTSTASSSPGSGDWRGWIWGSWSGSSPPGSGA